MGRICVIGGSLQYTGAAYYAAMSCLLAGKSSSKKVIGFGLTFQNVKPK